MNTCELYVPVVVKPYGNYSSTETYTADNYQVYPIPPRSTQPVMFDSVNTSFYEECVFDSFDMDEDEYVSDDFDGVYF